MGDGRTCVVLLWEARALSEQNALVSAGGAQAASSEQGCSGLLPSVPTSALGNSCMKFLPPLGVCDKRQPCSPGGPWLSCVTVSKFESTCFANAENWIETFSG
jgi:hypothetical protein